MTQPLTNPTIYRSSTLTQEEMEPIKSEYEALCVAYVQRGTDYWFGDSERNLTAREVLRAKEICIQCPLRIECLQLAHSIQPAPYGVWGGKRFR